MSGEAFTTRGTADLDPDKIATSPTAYALYENPLAIARGDPAAPRISPWALERIEAGDEVRYENLTAQTNNTTSFVEVLAFPFIQKGSIRITLEHSRSSGSGSNSEVQILVDGVVETSWSVGGTWTERSYDLTGIVPGTYVVVQHRMASTDATSSVRNLRMSTAGTDLWRGERYLKFSDEPT